MDELEENINKCTSIRKIEELTRKVEELEKKVNKRE
jgi:hypothetical protein